MQKVFLTGSTGYLGTKFVELYSPYFDIMGISRTDDHNPIDLLDSQSLKEAFNEFQPDFILHLAADVGRDATTSTEITTTNPAITKNLIDLALPRKVPFIFTSTEAVYGGKETSGNYVETDDYRPRSPYGTSKVISEKLLIKSGLPYLITRGHRHVGASGEFVGTKQFPDTLQTLENGKIVHLDSKKIFTPVLINNVCDIFSHYIKNDADKQILINIGVDRKLTYYDFFLDVARALNIQHDLVKADGNETGWPLDSSLLTEKLRKLNYPHVGYEVMIEIIKKDTA
jgi:dTDP-4-dehydrorhamnose reductase